MLSLEEVVMIITTCLSLALAFMVKAEVKVVKLPQDQGGIFLKNLKALLTVSRNYPSLITRLYSSKFSAFRGITKRALRRTFLGLESKGAFLSSCRKKFGEDVAHAVLTLIESEDPRLQALSAIERGGDVRGLESLKTTTVLLLSFFTMAPIPIILMAFFFKEMIAFSPLVIFLYVSLASLLTLRHINRILKLLS